MTDPTASTPTAVPRTDVAIEVTGLTRSYGKVEALTGIDLRIDLGECFALLGPNGAGKTTTTEILEGYRHRDGGEVERARRGPGARRRALALAARASCCRAPATWRTSPSWSRCATSPRYYPDPRDVDEVIEAVGLAEKRTARGSTLSGGQRRRLDVALGIIGRPELLFLDEPTTGFDPEARRDFWELIERAEADGTTILLTTHYLEEASSSPTGSRSSPPVRCSPATRRTSSAGGSAAGAVGWREGGDGRRSRTRRAHAGRAELAARLGGEVPELAVAARASRTSTCS